VWVLWDDRTDRPRGKTHALDCHMIDSFHWVKEDYRRVSVDLIPAHVERCGFCGGGRPAPQSIASRLLPTTPTQAPEAARRETPAGIQIGSTVQLLDLDSEARRSWTLVAKHEADPTAGRLSVESPIGKSLLGRDAGDEVTASTPGGIRRYLVLSAGR
jgi:hypothetical protein